jgi:hypothetical protein
MVKWTPANRTIIRTATVKPKSITEGVFDQILVQGIRKGIIPAKTQISRDWFRKQAYKITMSPTQVMREEQRRLQKKPVRVGDMVMYLYDPKYKKKLPYYDAFPLIFLIEKYNNGWLGINLHYLPFAYRAKLMDALYSLSSDKRYDEKTKLVISYKILKSASRFRWFRPCVHRYLANHVTSSFLRVYPAEWDIALFLPIAQFKKATQQKVWQDSLTKINQPAKRRARQERAAIATLRRMAAKAAPKKP